MTSSPSPAPTSAPTSANRHALTAVEKQRNQLDRLLKDPAKPAYIPAPPKEKTIRPPREMMKNIQGSSAGAGSGEFHVYKASRRREYERLKLIEEAAKQEIDEADFERKRKEAEAIAESKTSKNRAKRQKKKERAKGKAHADKPKDDQATNGDGTSDVPTKKRRLVNGKELLFKKPGEESEDESGGESTDEADGPRPPHSMAEPLEYLSSLPTKLAEDSKITIHEDD